MYFVLYSYGGRSPPYNYNTKYTSLPRVFDTPSSHSNFNPNSNSNSNLNSKKKVKIQTLRAFRRPHPRGLEGVRSNQIRSKIKVKSSQNRIKIEPGGHMGSSRWLQNGFRTANLATKMQNGAQHGSKMTMRRPQWRPRGCLGITLGRLGRLSERSWRLPDGPLGTFLKDILQF